MMIKSTMRTLFLLLAVLSVSADPEMLQDVCVADLSSGTKVNGYACKDPASITEMDFYFQGLATPGITNTSMGSLVTAGNVEKIPGLNTQGISMSRIDYAPGGLNPPHIHPRASEVVFVLQGQLDVGFITSANKLIFKSLNRGDVFVFPRGLVHFQKNSNRNQPASVIATFNSQLPGTQSIGATLFGATPAVPDDVLSKAFTLTSTEIQRVKSKFVVPKK